MKALFTALIFSMAAVLSIVFAQFSYVLREGHLLRVYEHKSIYTAFTKDYIQNNVKKNLKG